MDCEYKQQRILRRKLEKKWISSKTADDKQNYIDQRSKCVQLSKLKRCEYYKDLIGKHEGDQKALFKIVSEMLDTKNVAVYPQCNKTLDLANEFNNFYISKVTKLRSGIPVVTSNIPDVDLQFSGSTLDSFEPVTVDELREIIKQSNTKTASHDPLPQPVLKKLLDELLPYFCDLVNKSLSTGSMDGVKEAVIFPILKIYQEKMRRRLWVIKRWVREFQITIVLFFCFC